MLTSLLGAHRAAQTQPAAQQPARLCQRASWHTYGPPFSKTGCRWVLCCAGLGLCSGRYRKRDPRLSREPFVGPPRVAVHAAGGRGGAPHTLDHRSSSVAAAVTPVRAVWHTPHSRQWRVAGRQQGEPEGEAGDHGALGPHPDTALALPLALLSLGADSAPGLGPDPGSSPGIPPHEVADFLVGGRQAGSWTPAPSGSAGAPHTCRSRGECSRQLQLQLTEGPAADSHPAPCGHPPGQTLLTMPAAACASSRHDSWTGRQAGLRD